MTSSLFESSKVVPNEITPLDRSFAGPVPQDKKKKKLSRSMFAQVVVSFFLVCIGFKAYSSLSSSIPSAIVDQSLSKSVNKDHGNDSNIFPTVTLIGSETQANLKQVTKGTSTTTELSNEVVVGDPLPDESFDTQYGLRWYPQAPYDSGAEDEQFDSWKRCGSGADVDNDDQRNPGANEWFCNVGTKDFETSGDGCQTVSPWGAQMLDGVDSIFFLLTNGQGSFTGSAGHQYYGVIKLFEATYCTGTGVEFYAQGSALSVPLDEYKHNPYDNGFGSGRKIRSFYVYAKPHDSSLIPTSPNSIGFKLMPFPDYYMKPEDQTTCVQGARAYVPFTDEANWPGLDCVSSFDRKFCMTMDDNNWQKVAMYNSDVPAGDDSFGCVDFAGCSTCGGDTDSNSVNNINSYCYGSTLPALSAFPLGSFFHNVYTIQGNEICSDSRMSDPFSDRMLFCDSSDWYEDWCITIKIYDCYSREDCPNQQDGVIQATPDNPNSGPFFYISTPINLFCPDQTYGHRDGWEGGRKDNLSSISYYDKTTTLMGTAEDAPNAEGGYGWPMRTTGYIAKLTYCQGKGSNESKLMDF